MMSSFMIAYREQKSVLLARVLAMLAIGFFSAQASAQTNALNDLKVARTGDSTVLSFTLQGPWQGVVPSFLLANPSRLVLDLPNTNNELSKSAFDFGVGETRSVILAQSGTKTRAVINLNRNIPYRITTTGNQVLVTFSASSSTPALGSLPTVATVPLAAAGVSSAPQVQSTPALSTSSTLNMREVKNIDFRRGDDGSGRLVVDLVEGSSPINVRQQGGRLLLDIESTRLPDRLRRRLDVTDFATPVQRVSSVMEGALTRVTIEPKGAFEHSAYQTDSRIVVEIRAVKEDPNKLVQGARSGYRLHQFKHYHQRYCARHYYPALKRCTLGSSVRYCDAS
jgi:type IV pilus assembly protein PilQ